MLRATILGTGVYLPKKRLTNDDLAQRINVDDEWIKTRSGISERCIAAQDEASSDLGYQAAQQALERSQLKANEIELVIAATMTPDMLCPATACLVQHKLGIPQAATFDLSAACTGFIYALATGAQFIATGLYKHILVVGVDLLSRFTNYEDRDTCILFGDGAGAAILGPAQNDAGFLAYDLGGDGQYGDILQVPAGGSKLPASAATVHNAQHFIKMNGAATFRVAVRALSTSLETALGRAGLKGEDLSLLVPHQANLRIIEYAAKRLQLPLERVALNINKYGNMSSASVPVALDEALTQGKIKSGDLVALTGFGGGMTWGTIIMRWS
ncbi:MAG: hypothetical protein RLZ12_275 [Bacillota bacterium]|jgi:3-oxoacyl-[acyl-carrier-protein] synthase-3